MFALVVFKKTHLGAQKFLLGFILLSWRQNICCLETWFRIHSRARQNPSQRFSSSLFLSFLSNARQEKRLTMYLIIVVVVFVFKYSFQLSFFFFQKLLSYLLVFESAQLNTSAYFPS